MRQRAFVFLALLLAALPAGAGVLYEFEGVVTVDDTTDDGTVLFPVGTRVWGTFYLQPELATVQPSGTINNIFAYEYNIGGYKAIGNPDGSTAAYCSTSCGLLFDFVPDEWTLPGWYFEEMYFIPRFSVASIDADMSGNWFIDGNILDLSLPLYHYYEWRSEVTMKRVPEPGSLALFAIAIPMLLLLRRRRLG